MDFLKSCFPTKFVVMPHELKMKPLWKALTSTENPQFIANLRYYYFKRKVL